MALLRDEGVIQTIGYERFSVVGAPKRGKCDSDERFSGGMSELECRVMWCDIE